VADPLAALLDGEVRFALVSGASFFEVDEATGQPRQRGLADAVVPVGVGTIERIRAALGVEVGLDPSLPIARAISEPPPEPSVSVTPSIIASAVNLLVLGMLVSIIGLYLGGPGRRRAAGRPEAERPPPPGG
jgi:hypothetical protein